MVVSFVDRQAEMTLIQDAFKALQNYEEGLLRTPIIDFYGVEGIGKTAILQRIEKQCKDLRIQYVFIDASKSALHFSREVIRQARKYNILIDGLDEDGDARVFQRSTAATRALLRQGTTVMLLDSVDTNNEELVECIAMTLRDVIDQNKLFVVLASRKGLFFDSERSVSRKLTSFQVKPLNRSSCEKYLHQVEPTLDPEIRQCILDWTRGYPLAMQIMAQAVAERALDPREPAGQQELFALIEEQVIDQKVLARTGPTNRAQYKEELTLLSIPRRFNLVIMQDLIERFTPHLKRESSLAYMKLPRDINRDSDLLSWNMFRAGYTVEVPIRNLFLLKNRIQQKERYLIVHQFLADLNKQFANEVASLDRIRYLREYLYHSASILHEAKIIAILQQTVESIIAEPFAVFEQFYEEFLQDEELGETLGEQKSFVLSLLYQHLVRVHHQEVQGLEGRARLQHVRDIFFYLLQDPLIPDRRAALRQHLWELLKEEPSDQRAVFIEGLLQVEKLRGTLGKHFDLFLEVVREIQTEG